MTLTQLLLTLRLLANKWAAQDRSHGANPSGRVKSLRSIADVFDEAGDDELDELVQQLLDLTNDWTQADQSHMGRDSSRVNQMRLLLEEFETH